MVDAKGSRCGQIAKEAQTINPIQGRQAAGESWGPGCQCSRCAWPGFEGCSAAKSCVIRNNLLNLSEPPFISNMDRVVLYPHGVVLSC